MSHQGPVRVSIIVPCLNEELNIDRCYQRVSDVFAELEDVDFDIIFVDDGSVDGTSGKIKDLVSRDSRCSLIVNARNYGVYRSSFHALKYATGDVVIPMLPVDLQDPPELIPEFVRLWRQGNLVVAGARYEREEHFVMRNIRRIYYRLVSRLADYDIPRYVGEFQLIDRSLVNQLVTIDDYYPYIRGLIASLTTQRAIVPYVWQQRAIGKSNMNLPKLVDQGLNGIVSTTTAPLRLLSGLSFVISILGLMFGTFQIFAHFTFARAITNPGISSIIVLTCLFGAVSSVSFGLLAEYVGAIHAQVRGRLRVVEREKLNLSDTI